jgi:hypothetical protein
MPVLLTALTLSALFSSSLAGADGTGSCHCYRERTFDPARPAGADPYILATTRSSLLSASFGPSKRELVQGVMTGTSPDDLWIAHWVASRTGHGAAALLDAKATKGSWKAVLAGTPGLGKDFGEAMARGSSDGDLAALAVDDTLVARVGVQPAELAAARAAGATTNEVILAAVLATHADTTPASVLGQVKAGKASWGAVLQALGLAPKDLDGLVRQSIAR